MKSLVLTLKLILIASSLFAQVSYLGPDEPKPSIPTNNIPNYYFVDSNNSIYKIRTTLSSEDSLRIYKNVGDNWVDVADDTLRKYSIGVAKFKVQVAENGIIYLMVNPTRSVDDKIVLLTYQNNRWTRVVNINLERSDISIELFKLWNNDPIICTKSFDTLYVYKYSQNQLSEIANYYLDDGVNPSLSFQSSYLLLSFIEDNQLFVKKYQNGIWSAIYHTIQIKNINEYFIHTRLVELSQKSVLVVYGVFNDQYKLYFLSYSNAHLSSDSLELSEIANSAWLASINFKKNGDYCALYTNNTKLHLVSNNPSYSWTKNTNVLDIMCPGASSFELAMTKDFLPIIPYGHNSIIVSDTIRLLDKKILGGLKAGKSVIRKNAKGELFLLLVSANCKSNDVVANVFKYNGDSWVKIGDDLATNSPSNIVMEIDPVSNLPVIGIGAIFDNKILYLVNNRWKEKFLLPPALKNGFIQDIKFDGNAYLTILNSGSVPSVYKFISGHYLDVSSNFINDNITLVEQSKIFMDKNYDAYVVGLDKNTQEFKILVMRANGWDSLIMSPYKRTFPEAYYDLQFDSQNRLCMLYRYYNKRHVSGILRYNAANQTWEEPFNGIASLYNPYMNFFFDKNDKPYISLFSDSETGNIRLLQYTTYWDDVPNLKFNKGKTDYLYSYKHNDENYFLFSNITNHVIRFKDDLLSGVAQTKNTKSDYIVFPNPTTNYLYIKNEINSKSISKVRVLNSVGIELMTYTKVEMGDKLDFNSFSDGWYMVEITDSENYSSLHKVIINRK